jgi:hypothetical protein
MTLFTIFAAGLLALPPPEPEVRPAKPQLEEKARTPEAISPASRPKSRVCAAATPCKSRDGAGSPNTERPEREPPLALVTVQVASIDAPVSSDDSNRRTSTAIR